MKSCACVWALRCHDVTASHEAVFLLLATLCLCLSLQCIPARGPSQLHLIFPLEALALGVLEPSQAGSALTFANKGPLERRAGPSAPRGVGKPGRSSRKKDPEALKARYGPELAVLIRAERSLPAPTCPQPVTDDSGLQKVSKEWRSCLSVWPKPTRRGRKPQPRPPESHSLLSHLMDERNLEA